jgi:hypothetical protein
MQPLGPWSPDQPPLRGPSLIEAKNLIPREDGNYGPLPDVAATSTALAARCYGLVSAKSTTGFVKTFAGTATAIYQLESDGSWSDVSKTGGYSLDPTNGDRWRFSVFGDVLIAFCGINQAPQKINLASGTQFADLSATAPNAVHGGVVRDFMMFGQTYDGSTGSRPDRVWWSGIGDAENWPDPTGTTAQTVQSSYGSLPDGGYIQGIAPGVGGADAAIFGETRVWRVTYEGPPTVFRFDAVERGRGCYVPGSLISVGKLAYYYSEDGWYAFDGVQSVPIGTSKVDRWFLNDLDDGFRDNMWAAADTDQKVIMWAYPGSGNIGGLPNHLLMFSWATGNWARGEITVEALESLVGIGYTLEGLDNLGFTLDTLPFSLDSRVWAGGGSYVGVVGSDRRLGRLGGTNLQADWTSAEFSGQNGSRFFLDNARIYSDCTTMQGAVDYRDTIAGSLTSTGYLTQDEDQLPFLLAARYGRVKGRCPAGASWTAVQGYDLSMRPEGRR